MDTKQLLEAVETIQVIKSLFGAPPNPWIPVVAAIGGALIGSIASIVPGYLLDLKKRRDERVSVTTALLAEIRGILSIIKQRKYVEQFKLAAEHLSSAPGTKLQFAVKVPSHYSRVYQAYVERLGLIDAGLAAKIIEFHQLVDSVVQDISAGGLVAEKGGNLQAFEQLVAISEAAIAIGTSITEQWKGRAE